MKLSKYILLGMGALTFTGCQDFLGNKPKGYTIPETYEDYAQLLNHASLQRSSGAVLSYITDDMYLTSEGEIKDEAGNAFTDFNYKDKDDQERNLYSFVHGQVLTAGNSDDLWDNAYANIFTYNAVANNILNASGGTDAQKKAAHAEALVGRAFEYLNLVNIYGNHYNSKTASSDYGVPILTSEVVGEDATYTRNSVEEVYDKILSDLEAAIPNLQETPSNVYHPSRTIGYAFRSRVYLYMGKYKEALENANEALKLKNELVDYKPYTTTNSTFGRIILESDPSITFPEDVDNVENIFMRNLNGGGSGFFSNIAASKDLIETYKSHLAENGEDMRLRLFFATDSANFTMNPNAKPKKFKGYSTYAPYLNLNVGFTTPEIYLIAAECEARIGDLARVRTLLNTLRDTRIKNNVAYTEADTPSREAALKLVIEERRREFAFCGPARLFDLKRLNREDWFKKDVVHSADGETWTLPANDMRYIMPIPQTVLDFNPDMPQYER